jgi:GNAT superfamily N-acetyltransferase
MIEILNTQTHHAHACAELEQICYPYLSDAEKLRAEQFANHIALFPAGQFVAIDTATGGVVGATGGFLTHIDVVLRHTFFDMTSEGWFARHEPDADMYHGATMTVHPDYRGRGIARRFYDARKIMCEQLRLRGQVICGMLPGFADYKAFMSAEDYVKHVAAGLLFDPTLTVQLRNGFAYKRLIRNYFEDPPSEGWAALLVWETVLTL